jgi:uncharacterized membrane protein
MKSPMNRLSKKPSKLSVYVLTAAAVLFLCAVYHIYSGDILTDDMNSFSVYRDQQVEYEKAIVNDVLSDNKEPDVIVSEAYTGTQELDVTIKSGRYKGDRIVAYNYFGPNTGVPVEKGDSVTLTIKTHTDGRLSAAVYEFNRIPAMTIYLLLFFVVVLIVGGVNGLKSLIGLAFTVICLFTVLIPLLLKGAPTIPATFITCAYIALVSFTILGGVQRKSVSAFLGTLAGIFLAMVFALIVQKFAKIDGLRLEDAEPLIQMRYLGVPIKLKGLLVAGIIISALGAVMDVSMSISSSLEEIHAADPSLSAKELFRSGMNIGRDMVGTMTNTLILAFLGSEFTLSIFLYFRGLTFYHLFSTVFVTLETISGISSSIGMVLAIPLTALISSRLITENRFHL